MTLEQDLERLTATSPPLIKRSRHPSLPLTIYNYTDTAQWKKHWNYHTMMSRGLVLEHETSKVVARPMPKFFNHSEGRHTTPDTERFTVLQKADGSLGIWFCYEGEWHMATRGSFTSAQAVEGKRMAAKIGLGAKSDPSKTYCFEMISPADRHIVDYGAKEELLLLAVVDTTSGFDAPNRDLPGIAAKLGVRSAEYYDPGDKRIEKLAKVDLLGEEGFVVRFDSSGERVKMKFESYMAAVRGGLSGGKPRWTQDSVLRKVVEIMSKAPNDRVENHLASIPDEFYGEADAAQKRYLALRGEKEEEFDRITEKHAQSLLEDIPQTTPGRDHIWRYLRIVRRAGKPLDSLRDAVRMQYATSQAAESLGFTLPEKKVKVKLSMPPPELVR